MSQTTLEEMQKARAALQRANNRLSAALKEFKGTEDEQGVWQPGPQLLFEEAVLEEAAEIYESSAKPPPENVRMARATSRVKQRDPQLYANYHRLQSEIENIKLWAQAQKQIVSAWQSEVGLEKALAGIPPSAPQPAWSGS